MDAKAAITEAPRQVFQDQRPTEQDADWLGVEEPLQLRIGPAPLAVVMRTPGHDLELATGFALSEGIITDYGQLDDVRYCRQNDAGDNVVVLYPSATLDLDLARFSRSFFSTSSCGICGKRSVEEALRVAPPLTATTSFSAEALQRAPDRLRSQQPLFKQTGALHAAGVMDQHGEIICVREDIGRHNAVDKILGWSLREKQDLSECALVVSGRISFEIIQKALAGRIPCVVAVGGVSSLARRLAEESHLILAGFVTRTRMSVYSGSERIS